MKNFLIKLLFFITPIFIILIGIEILLRTFTYSVTVKKDYFKNNKDKIEIIALGSSHFERGINPEFLNWSTLNLSNSGQRINENFDLLKNFQPQLSNLKLVIIELSYDWLERDKELTSPIVDHLNLTFYNTNTFQRKLKLPDHLLYFSDPEYFSHRIMEHFKNNQDFNFNQFGFDKAKFYGSYQAVNYVDSLIKDNDIYVENASNPEELKKNTEVLNALINYCKKQKLKILIYDPPVHFRYNRLRKNQIVKRRDSILDIIKNNNQEIKVFMDEKNKDFTADLFYNAEHLNPRGAKKATLRLNEFIQQNYSF